MRVQSVAANRTIGTIVYAVCAASTASAEYDLAVASGFAGMAWCLPAALDAYVLVALRERRDTSLAVGVLLAVVATSHLVSSGFLEVSAFVVIGISSVAPLILWRVHGLLWGERPKKVTASAPPAPLVVPQPQVTAPVETVAALTHQPAPADRQEAASALPGWVEEALETPVVDLDTLVEKLLADAPNIPGRPTVMKTYGVSDHTARRALEIVKERLAETSQELAEERA